MLQALLLSRDQDIVRIMRRAFDSASIQLEVVTGSDQALGTLQKQKFDAVLIDVDDVHQGAGVIPSLRGGKSNQRSIVFAITNGITTVKTAFEIGANFVLDKPVSLERATRSLKAAHGLIMRERRRYFRAAVSILAYVSYGSVNTQAPVNNISESGLSLKLANTAPLQGAVMIRLTLPGSTRELELQGDFVSGNRAGTVGVRFGVVPPASKAELDAWLNRQIQQSTAPVRNSLNRR
jgi:ActR/RegA family two-component response regulator